MKTFNNDPMGYQRYVRDNNYRQGTEFLLPHHLCDALQEEDRRRQQEAKDAQSATPGKNGDTEDAFNARGANTAYGTTPLSSAEIAKAKAQQALETEQAFWEGVDTQDARKSKRQHHSVFRPDQAMALYKSMGMRQEDDKVRLKKIYQDLVERGTTTRMVAGPKDMQPLEALAAKQPHMKQVVQFVAEQIALAQRSRKPLRLQPMLLVGEAGVGKTHFAKALAKALATTVHVQALDADLSTSFLLGSDRKWSNAQHGLLFEQLLMGRNANPVIVLDEIDKTHRDLRNGSPLASLHSVLEPVSAKAVRDISLLFQFDASLVTWIATANQVVHLDAPLRSRFKEFHIMPPDAQECLVLAAEVMRAAIDSVAIKDFSTDVSLRRHLAHLPARQIWQLTREAMGKAVACQRKSLQLEDLPEWLTACPSDGAHPQAHQLH